MCQYVDNSNKINTTNTTNTISAIDAINTINAINNTTNTINNSNINTINQNNNSTTNTMDRINTIKKIINIHTSNYGVGPKMGCTIWQTSGKKGGAQVARCVRRASITASTCHGLLSLPIRVNMYVTYIHTVTSTPKVNV